MRHSAPSILQDVQTRLVLVESGKLTTVVMENTPINVPNTASRMNKTIIFIGLLLVIVGGGIVSFLTYRKQELKVK